MQNKSEATYTPGEGGAFKETVNVGYCRRFEAYSVHTDLLLPDIRVCTHKDKTLSKF